MYRVYEHVIQVSFVTSLDYMLKWYADIFVTSLCYMFKCYADFFVTPLDSMLDWVCS